MDYIREFDIRLEKEMYYAGETLSGIVILDTIENFKLRAIRVLLRGKAHTEWKVMVSGDRRTVKDDQYFIEDRAVIWGKEKAEGSVPILPRGMHQFPFRFQLPESSLPCSFESRAGTIRYYLKCALDIPYQSAPQGMKYFTIIGPHIDCMDYLKPIRGESKRKKCCLCCESNRVSLRTDFERSAYVCGESLKVKADIDNQSEEEVRLKLRLVQYVEYYIDRGVLGVQKEVSHTILEYRGGPVTPHTRTRWDSQQTLVVPTMPPTLVGVCRLIQIYYLLKVNIDLEKSGEDLHMHFPMTIATVPFRIPNSNQQPQISYDVASDHVEGGIYIGPEFLLGGGVYEGDGELEESIVLFRPVYPTVKFSSSSKRIGNSQPQSSASTPNATKGLKVKLSKDQQNRNQNETKPMTNSTSSNSFNAAKVSNSNAASTSASSKNKRNGDATSALVSNPSTSAIVTVKDTLTNTTSSPHESSADPSRPQTSSKKMQFQPETFLSTTTSSSIICSNLHGTNNTSKATGDSESKNESGMKKIIGQSSTSSTGKSEGEQQHFNKYVKKSSLDKDKEMTPTTTTTPTATTGTESNALTKDEKTQPVTTKITNMTTTAITALPGRAVKLESLSSMGNRKSLEKRESMGESSTGNAGSPVAGPSSAIWSSTEHKTKV